MKNLFLLIFSLTCSLTKAQQSLAQNWTKSDCSGNSHTLFDYLDSNKVVVMEFGMGCSSCTDAAGDLSSFKKQYNLSHPGKVKFFYMDFWPGHTCSIGVNTMLGSYSFDAGFENCGSDLTYYTSANPMTLIVIAAGYSREVIYNVKKYIYYQSDSTSIKNAINSFFITAGIKDALKNKNDIKIYPNPTAGAAYIEINCEFISEKASVNIYDAESALVKTISNISLIAGKNSIQLNLSDLASGKYFIELINNSQKRYSSVIIKN